MRSVKDDNAELLGMTIGGATTDRQALADEERQRLGVRDKGWPERGAQRKGREV